MGQKGQHFWAVVSSAVESGIASPQSFIHYVVESCIHYFAMLFCISLIQLIIREFTFSFVSWYPSCWYKQHFYWREVPIVYQHSLPNIKGIPGFTVSGGDGKPKLSRVRYWSKQTQEVSQYKAKPIDPIQDCSESLLQFHIDFIWPSVDATLTWLYFKYAVMQIRFLFPFKACIEPW